MLTVLTVPRNGGMWAERGHRPYMEDFTTLLEFNIGGHPGFVYGLYDGHGGPEVAQALAAELAHQIVHRLHPGMTPVHVKNLLTQVFHEQDNRLRWAVYNGSAAIVALTFKGMLYFANLGDSRGVLFDSNGTVIIETQDHKPNLTHEQARILAAGGSVDNVGGVPRVNGQLAISRSFGDFILKRNGTYTSTKGPVIATPDIYVQVVPINGRSHYILLASDGLWDVFTTQEVITHLTALNWDCRLITELAINHRMSCDNVTFLWAKL